MIQTDMPCSLCGQPMIGITISRYYALVCDNWGCGKYRQIQGNIERRTDFGAITTFMPAPLTNISPQPSKEKARKKTVRRKGLVYARRMKEGVK